MRHWYSCIDSFQHNTAVNSSVQDTSNEGGVERNTSDVLDSSSSSNDIYNLEYEEAGHDTDSEDEHATSTGPPQVSGEDIVVEPEIVDDVPTINIMDNDDWKSGTLLYLRQRFFLPFEALTYVSQIMEEYHQRNLNFLKV